MGTITTKTCDTCGKNVEELVTIKDEYQVDNIAEVCPACEKEIDDILLSCTKALHIKKKNFIRDFIRNLKARYHA